MKDLSMHILDIAQNSIRANATLIEIKVNENISEDILSIEITDNGCGMNDEMVKQVTNPFFTSRTTRKIGMGIPLIKQNAELTGGNIEIKSTPDIGTTLIANFKHKHIDRPPWGDIAGTIALIFSGNPDRDFVYTHSINHQNFELNSKVVKEELEGLPIHNVEVIRFIKEMITENLAEMGVSFE